MANESKNPRVLYVIAQFGCLADAKALKLPDGARVVETLHLERLADDCAVAAIYKGEGRKAVQVSDHWDGGGLRRASFLQALGQSAIPLVVRVRDDVVSLRWA
jgi:hypothetical protein